MDISVSKGLHFIGDTSTDKNLCLPTILLAMLGCWDRERDSMSAASKIVRKCKHTPIISIRGFVNCIDVCLCLLYSLVFTRSTTKTMVC